MESTGTTCHRMGNLPFRPSSCSVLIVCSFTSKNSLQNKTFFPLVECHPCFIFFFSSCNCVSCKNMHIRKALLVCSKKIAHIELAFSFFFSLYEFSYLVHYAIVASSTWTFTMWASCMVVTGI